MAPGYDNDSTRFVDLMEEERKRLARDIHDGPAQGFTNITMRLEIIRRLLEGGRTDDALGELDRLQAFTRNATNDIRRLIFDLRPTFLENGVVDAIRLYCERFAQTSGIAVTLEGTWEKPALPRQVEVAIFRICQEALNNVSKHANASSVGVSLIETEATFQLNVTDNGQGFDTTRKVPGQSYGVAGMHERMTLIGGSVTVQSSVGAGTTVVCEVKKQHE